MNKVIFNATSSPANILTQSKINVPNTIYVFETEYSLNNNTSPIVLPANCILEFQGGKIKNGKIKGNNTNIIATNANIFSNIKFEGSWLNSYLDIRWFGANENNTDNKDPLQEALDSGWKSLYIPEGTFYISDAVQVNKEGITITGAGKEKTILRSADGKTAMRVKSNKINISDIYFNSVAYGYPDANYDRNRGCPVNEGISIERGFGEITVRGCAFDGFTMGIIFQRNNKDVLISECVFRNMKYIPVDAARPADAGAGGYGIVFQHLVGGYTNGTDNYIVEKCVFEKTLFRHSIYSQSSNGKIINNVFYGDRTEYATSFESRVHVNGTKNLIISNNTFDDGILAIDVFTGNPGMPYNENVIINNNNFKKIKSPRYDSSVIKLTGIKSATISNNLMYGIESSAITLAPEVNNLIISNNNIKTIQPTGTSAMAVHGIISYNSSGKSSRNISIHDNLIDVDSKGQNCPIFFYLSDDYHDLFIKNNILCNGYIGVCINQIGGYNVTVYDSNIENNITRGLQSSVVKIEPTQRNVRIVNNY